MEELNGCVTMIDLRVQKSTGKYDFLDSLTLNSACRQERPLRGNILVADFYGPTITRVKISVTEMNHEDTWTGFGCLLVSRLYPNWQ